MVTVSKNAETASAGSARNGNAGNGKTVSARSVSVVNVRNVKKEPAVTGWTGAEVGAGERRLEASLLYFLWRCKYGTI